MLARRRRVRPLRRDGRALTLPALADGEHNLRVRGRAGADVDPSPATRTWTVDTTAPETTLPDAPGGFTVASDETGVSYRCMLDGAAVPCATLLLPAAPGEHVFAAAAVDRAGNADATPARRAWTVAAPAVEAAAPKLALSYAFRNGRFTRLTATGIAPGTKLTVTVKRPGKPATTTTLAKLVGKRLPNRTKIVVRAGTDRRTLVIRGGRRRTGFAELQRERR